MLTDDYDPIDFEPEVLREITSPPVLPFFAAVLGVIAALSAVAALLAGIL